MTIALDLPPELEARLKEAAQAHALSVDQFALQVLEQCLPSAQTARPIWEEFAALASQTPNDVLRQLPTDGAEQHDHYVYGTAKRAS